MTLSQSVASELLEAFHAGEGVDLIRESVRLVMQDLIEVDAAEQIGIPGLTPHELRHTCASLAVSAGANVKALQRMLGHSSAKETLDTYSDLFDNDLDGVAVALNDTAGRLNVGKLWAKGDLEPHRKRRAPTKEPNRRLFSWSPLSDSNRRPPLYKSGALAN